MKPIIRRLIFGLFIIIFSYSSYQIFTILNEQDVNQKKLAKIQEIYNNNKTISETTDVLSSREARTSFQELLDINSDIDGWIKIADTKIDYPILQSTDNEFYLTHNYKKETAATGSIFKDYRNTNEFIDKNTIIYGHYSDDQTMFTDLHQYLDKDFAQKHRVFQYDSLALSYDIEIFSVYQTTTSEQYLLTAFSSNEAFQDYIQNAQNRSMYDFDTTVAANDRILTLSTCDLEFAGKKGRFVIQGKLVKKATLDQNQE
ncbi:MAG: class B sortase [Streptococcaceae bacterium]|jgi:sortase B|nr:class B sortase [Streptococcaceae bacterium]MCH4177226.1 class B sortase [Streptococcaceae bacterium]